MLFCYWNRNTTSTFLAPILSFATKLSLVVVFYLLFYASERLPCSIKSYSYNYFFLLALWELAAHSHATFYLFSPPYGSFFMLTQSNHCIRPLDWLRRLIGIWAALQLLLIYLFDVSVCFWIPSLLLKTLYSNIGKHRDSILKITATFLRGSCNTGNNPGNVSPYAGCFLLVSHRTVNISLIMGCRSFQTCNSCLSFLEYQMHWLTPASRVTASWELWRLSVSVGEAFKQFKTLS